MTNAMWELYWLTRMISLNSVAGPVALAGFFSLMGVGGIHYLAGCEGANKVYISRGLKLMAGAIATFLIFGAMYVFTPDKNEAAFIVAGGAVVAAAQSDAGQKIAQKSVAVLEGSLDNILGKEAVEKAQIDVERKVVDAVKNQMGIKQDDSSPTKSPAGSSS
jgi:hypothetical protein